LLVIDYPGEVRRLPRYSVIGYNRVFCKEGGKMPFQPTATLTAYIMGDALKEAVGWAPSLLGLVRFGGLRLQYFRLILICLDAYVKGIAIGYTFRDKYELLLSTMVKPDKVDDYAPYLCGVAQKRVESHGQEISSIIDFLIATELAKDKLNFDSFLERAKKKVKIDSAAPRLKLTFEEGTAFGANYPDIVSSVISVEKRTSSFDWDKAKLMGLKFDIHAQELDLAFLKRWATHNLGLYCREYFPELIMPLGV
jgi:hypothetical protein